MIIKYPEKATLKEVLSGGISSTSLKRICKNNGIFLLSPDKDTTVRDAHLFYWGFRDINAISNQLEDTKNYKKSFRLSLDFEPNSGEGSGFNAICTALTQYKNSVAPSKQIIFDSYTIVTEGDSQLLIGEISYTKRKPGRVELLADVTRKFSFRARCAPSSKIDIDFIFSDRNDISIAKSMVDTAITTSDQIKAPVQISLKPLKISERVDLFDRFFEYAFSNWKFEALRDIKISDGQSEVEEEIEQEEIVQSILSGIKSAQLSGTGLRMNPIVIKAVEKGYFFPRATIRFEHRRDAQQIQVDIAFNGDDLLLEINMISTYEIEDDRPYKIPMPVDEQQAALEELHDALQILYNQILSERPAL